jgi:dTDP-4-amino-4,6-dideoxygalactose transaminase
MTVEERKALIARYAEGVREVEQALDGFPAAELTAHPIPGKWSAREIVHHLGDSESTSAQRIRRLLTENRPVITGYDQDLYARQFRYNERDHADAMAAFRSARAITLPLLNALTEAEWKREGWHTEGGVYTPEKWLQIYAGHAHGHADQIRRLREALARG